MDKFSSMLKRRTSKSMPSDEGGITDKELFLLRKLKAESKQTFESLVHILEQLTSPGSPEDHAVSKKAYLGDPLWKIVGKASSGRSSDDSAIDHDKYLYGSLS